MADRLEIIIEVDDKGNVKIKNLGQELGKLEATTEKTGGALSGFGDIAKGAFAALSVGLVAKTTLEMVNLGVDVGRAEQSLAAYAGSAEEAARTTEMVQAAAGGAVSRLDAMQNASQLMAMGLATSAEEAAHLTEVALTLGASMGRGPQESFQDFALLLANQSIPRLDTFGISSGRVRKRILELQAANEGMSRETAFMTAVLEDAEGKMKALDEAGFEAASSIDVVNARFEDLKINMAQGLADTILPSIDAALSLAEATREEAQALALTDISYEEYVAQLGRAGELRAALTQEEFEAVRATEAAAAAMAERGTPAAVGYAGAMGDAAGAAGDLVINMEQAELRVKGLTRKQVGQDLLNTLINNADQAGDEFDTLFRDIATGFLDMSDDEVTSILAFKRIEDQWVAMGTTIDEQIERADTFFRSLEALRDFPDIDLKLTLHGNVTGIPPGLISPALQDPIVTEGDVSGGEFAG